MTGYLPIERKRSFRRSRTFGLLMLVFVLACIAGYFVVRAAVTNTVEHQAVAIADGAIGLRQPDCRKAPA